MGRPILEDPVSSRDLQWGDVVSLGDHLAVTQKRIECRWKKGPVVRDLKGVQADTDGTQERKILGGW